MKYLADIGGYAIMVIEVFKKPTKWRIMKTLILKEIDELVFGSLGIIIFISFFIGAVVAIQTALNLTSELIPKNLIGFATRQSIILEFAPTFVSIIMAGKVGSYITSSIGTMRVTEQIDALACMGASPIQYLVVPRFLACLFMIPVLTIMADFMGIVGGYFYSVMVLGIDKHHYWHNSEQVVGSWELFTGVLKSIFFGGAIALVSCHQGFYCGAGAEGVGKATIASFVYSFVLILLLDLFLNIGLETLYYTLWPHGRSLL
ncbi:MAG: ABC transporter permease [Planctomycetota bacterium]